jgi:tetratricopeptide (TPR) repeat protein
VALRRRHPRSLVFRTLTCVFFALLLTGLTAAPRAVAQQTSEDIEARTLFDSGRKLYEAGQYEEAVSVWQRAYGLSSKPLILFNIGNAYERNGELSKAIEVLTRYRVFASPDEADLLSRRIKHLEDRLTEASKVPVAVAPPSRPKYGVETSLLSAGFLGVGSGLILGSASRNERTKARVYCVGPNAPCQRPADAFLRKERQLAWSADVAFSMGAAALTGSVVLWVLKAKKRRSVGDIQATPTLNGAVVRGHF